MRLLSFLLSFTLLAQISSKEVEEVYLKTPDLSDENIIGWKAGIRPFRKSGIRIEAERLQDKLIIHNYGYGGSGLTLCFGGSEEVLQILKQVESDKPIAILGAGVIGLAVAYDLLEQGKEVHIYADAFSPYLTSNVAAGIWSPPSSPDSATEEQKSLIVRLIENSRKRFLPMANSQNPEFLGVHWLQVYQCKVEDPLKKRKSAFSHEGRIENPVEIHFDNGLIKEGVHSQELGIDGMIFMNDLMKKVALKGAYFEERYFANQEETLSLEEEIIINCTSIGSKELFHDDDFVPIGGHLVYAKPQVGVDYVFSQNVPGGSYWVCLYPWQDRLIIGGVFETEQNEPDSVVIYKLIQNARESLRN